MTHTKYTTLQQIQHTTAYWQHKLQVLSAIAEKPARRHVCKIFAFEL